MSFRAKRMSTIRRVICYIVTFAMIVGMAPVTAHAEEETFGYIVEYNSEAATVTANSEPIDGGIHYDFGEEDVAIEITPVDLESGWCFRGVVIVENEVETDFIKADPDDGTVTYTIPASKFTKEYKIVVVDWMQPFDNEWKVDYMTMYDDGSGVYFGTTAEDAVEDNMLWAGEIMDFTVGETINVLLVPPEGIDTAPYKVMLHKNMADSVDITGTVTGAGAPYLLSYTPEDEEGFAISIHWTKEQFDFEMLEPDEEGEYVVTFLSTVAADMTVADIDGTDNVTGYATYEQEGRVILNGDARLEFTIPSAEKGKLTDVFVNGEALDLSDTDVYNEETGKLVLDVSMPGEDEEELFVDFFIMEPGYHFDYAVETVGVTANGENVERYTDIAFPEGGVTFEFTGKYIEPEWEGEEGYFATIYGIIVDSKAYGKQYISADMLYDSEKDGYFYTITDINQYYYIQVIDWDSQPFDNQYMFKYSENNDAYVSLSGSEDRLYSYRTFDFESVDANATTSFDFEFTCPNNIDQAPYRLEILVNGENTPTIVEEAAFTGSDGVYSYTYNHTGNSGFEIKVYWEQAEYDFENIYPEYGQFETQYYITNCLIESISDVDGEDNLVRHLQWDTSGKIIISGDATLEFKIPDKNKANIESISIDGQDIVLDGTGEYNPDTGILTVTYKPKQNIMPYVEIYCAETGYQVCFNDECYTATVNGQSVTPWELMEYDADTYTIVFAPRDDVDPSSISAVTGIRVTTGSGDNQEVHHYRLGTGLVYDEENNTYTYELTDTTKACQLELLDWELDLYDNEYRFEYGSDLYTVKVDGEAIEPWTAYNYGDKIGQVEIVPNDGADKPYAVYVYEEGMANTEILGDDIVQGAEGYTFTYDWSDYAATKVTIIESEARYLYEHCNPEAEAEYVFEFTVNTENYESVVDIELSDDNAYVKHAVYNTDARYIFNAPVDVTFNIKPEDGKEISQIMVNEAEMDLASLSYDEGTGVYSFVQSVSRENAPRVTVNFTEGLGYKIYYNTDTSVMNVTVTGNDALESGKVFPYPEEGSVVVNVELIQDIPFSGIKVTAGDTVTFVKDTELEKTGNVYTYTIPSLDVATTIEVVDWYHPFNNEYILRYPVGYEEVVMLGEEQLSPETIYDCVNGQEMVFNITPPSDATGIYSITVKYNEQEGIDWSDNIVPNGDGTYSFSVTPTSDMGMEIIICWSEEQILLEQLHPNDENGESPANYYMFFDSYNGVMGTGNVVISEPEGCSNIVAQARYRTEGRVILSSWEAILVASITPDKNCSFVGIDGMGETRIEADTLAYDEDTNTYTYEWNVQNGSPSFAFEANKSIDFSATGTTDSVTITGTTVNVSEVYIELPINENNRLAQTVSVNEDGTFKHTFDISGAGVPDHSTYEITVTDSWFTELVETGEVKICDEHIYVDCESEYCDFCEAKGEAPGHSYVDCEDLTCENCEHVREAAEAHAYTDCTDASCDNAGCSYERTNAATDHSYTDCTDVDCNNEGCPVTREAAETHAFTDCTDADCNNEGCPATREAAETHVYTDCTDASCDNAGCTVTRTAEAEHKYTDCTDASCNNAECAVTREAAVEHKYTNCEDTTCDNEGCTVTRGPQEHSSDGDCDEECNACGAALTTSSSHTFSGCEDTDCDVCGETRTAGKHEYADCTATACSNCTYGTRTAPGHKYADCVDTTCDNTGCTFERTDAPGHDTDGDCDEKCDVCNGALISTADHTYSGCDDTACDVCGQTRTALAHKYTDCDDTTCDNEGCDKTRTALTHKYTDCADTTCNTCNKTRTAPGHSYQGQTWLKDASSHWQKCANCSATSTKEAHKMVEQADGSSKCSTCGHIVESKEVPEITVSYRTHIESVGWEGKDSDTSTWKQDGVMSGTSGRSLRLEGINIVVDSAESDKNVDLGIQYTTHCESYGWLPWSADGDMSGTSGESKRLEAIMIKLTGDDADKYDVYYRVHAEYYGWLNWAKNGAPSGTAGYSKRLEGIQIVVVKKDEAFNQNMGGITSNKTEAYIANSGYSPVLNGEATSNTEPVVSGTNVPNVSYRTHVEKYGWQAWKYNGQMSGTSGESKRLEGIEIKLTNKDCEGGIAYTTHVEKYAWQGTNLDDPSTWRQNGAMAGTSGESKRLEAICITLTGEMAEKYDVYYRVHAEQYGWLNWTCNGAPAGTAGLSKRLEGIQIVILPKGEKPSDAYQGITSTNSNSYIAQ